MKKQTVLRLEEDKLKNLKVETIKHDISIQKVLEDAVDKFLENPLKWVETYNNQTVE